MTANSSRILALSAFLSLGAQAEAPDPWTGEAEVGAVVTTGNTETENLTAKLGVTHERDKWRQTGRLEALNSSENKITTAERYFLSGKVDYKFREFDYAFAIGTYEDDRFSGYDYRATMALGYGRRVISHQTLTLDLEAGPGARRSKLDVTGDTQNESLLRGSGALKWLINDHSTFTEELTVEAGEDATISKSITGLKTQIAGSLATKLTFTVKNTSDVPVGIEETDTETAVTLVYSF